LAAEPLLLNRRPANRIGLDCGPSRLPLRSFPAQDEGALRAALDAVGFFEFASKVAA